MERSLLRTPDPLVSILMYHQVGDFAPMRAHRANYCDRRQFALQMRFLARFGYRVLSLDDAIRCLRGEAPTPPKAVVLTFDDAYDNFADHALPELQRHGFTATVYAISNWLGREMAWADKDPQRAKPSLMTAERLRAVRAAGITIGSHTANHVKLAEVDPQTKRRELIDSKAALEDALGERVEHLCYPFGRFDLDAVHAAAEAGYRTATTCLRGPAEPTDHPLVLPRKAISYGDNLLGYWWKLAMKQAPKPDLDAWREQMREVR